MTSADRVGGYGLGFQVYIRYILEVNSVMFRFQEVHWDAYP